MERARRPGGHLHHFGDQTQRSAIVEYADEVAIGDAALTGVVAVQVEAAGLLVNGGTVSERGVHAVVVFR
jgi:hypothetical protein